MHAISRDVRTAQVKCSASRTRPPLPVCAVLRVTSNVASSWWCIAALGRRPQRCPNTRSLSMCAWRWSRKRLPVRVASKEMDPPAWRRTDPADESTHPRPPERSPRFRTPRKRHNDQTRYRHHPPRDHPTLQQQQQQHKDHTKHATRHTALSSNMSQQTWSERIARLGGSCVACL